MFIIPTSSGSSLTFIKSPIELKRISLRHEEDVTLVSERQNAFFKHKNWLRSLYIRVNSNKYEQLEKILFKCMI